MAIYRLGFVMEQTLGHVTHDRNLRQWLAADGSIIPHWMPVEFQADDLFQRLPLVRGNWSLRASLRARRLVAAALRRERLDGLLFHTQVTSLFSVGHMRARPAIVSLDATPLNLDTVGAAYDHARSGIRAVEALKNGLNRRAFRAARHLVAWSQWAKDSLAADYGIPPGKVTVIPPGVDLGRWCFERSPRPKSAPVRLLFVGGDFRRKGGELLLRAYRERLADCCELDIATRDDVDASGPGCVRVHRGLRPNTPELMALFEQADVFVFPTLGDCLPIAVMEAMAAELPVVASRVGALHEEVVDGVTGFLVPPGDAGALAERVEALCRDPGRRADMGLAGRKRAEERFDGSRNYAALLGLYKRCVDGRC